MEKINVAELLKDCPKGMELDCAMYEDVFFDKITDNQIFPICIKRIDGHPVILTKYGGYANCPSSKCVIFPKGRTTWEGFIPPCKFKAGDVLYVDCADEESDGDLYKYIFILKEIDNLGNHFSYCHLCIDKLSPCSHYLFGNRYTPRLATEEEKAKLFKAIKDRGYRWDDKTKILEKLTKSYKEETKNNAIFDYNAQCCDIKNDIIKKDMEEELIPRINFDKYCKDKYLLDLGNYEIKEENGKTYAVRKQFEYPKTYKECCKELGHPEALLVDRILGYKGTLLSIFQELLICRDAYWKIAGEQMGLEKPWKPDYTDKHEKKYAIWVGSDKIETGGAFISTQMVLTFPTIEMRDAFSENFKKLINQCKELL